MITDQTEPMHGNHNVLNENGVLVITNININTFKGLKVSLTVLVVVTVIDSPVRENQ